MTDLQAWAALLALGASHGINPGMGWLFAVALGLQEGRRRAVFRALLPIAIGHALSIGAVVLVVGAGPGGDPARVATLTDRRGSGAVGRLQAVPHAPPQVGGHEGELP